MISERMLASHLLMMLLGVLMGCIYMANTRIQNKEIASQQFKRTPVDHPFAQPHNSATGTLFSGEAFRRFSGHLRFSEGRSNMRSSSTPPQMTPANCRKWGVVTTINAPSLAVQKVAALDESWCLVIVADRKTPSHYVEGLPKTTTATKKRAQVFFLSVADQEGYVRDGQNNSFAGFVELTPYNHFARKNIGYLYAIRRGASARLIFDFDDDNIIKSPPGSSEKYASMSLLDSEETVAVDVLTAGVAGSTNHLAFNPHPRMEATVNHSWPRGFPLEYLRSAAQDRVLSTNKRLPMASIGVLQFCADENPDVDAVHRLTKPLPMYFQSQRSIAVSSKMFVPYNAQATIYTQKAFWAMLLPTTVPGRVSDIWRSYFAECLFRSIGLGVVFLPSRIDQIRNDHNYLADMQAEEALYYKTGQLLEYLNAWTSTESTLPGRMEALWIGLYERGYIELDDVTLVQNWLQTLVDMKYTFAVPTPNNDTGKTGGGRAWPAGLVPFSDPPSPAIMENEIVLTKVPEVISPEWRGPKNGYCYEKGENWKACAGKYMLYPPTPPSKLWERKTMCLHEPLCWKQLDWRYEDPPKVSCDGVQNSFRFYDWSFHDGVMASLSSAIESTLANVSAHEQEVFLCNVKHANNAIRNYHRTFHLCPAWDALVGSWTVLYSKEKSEGYFQQLSQRKHARDAQVHIFGFGPPVFEFYMSFNRTILLNSCHRIDLHRCTRESSAAVFEKIRALASSGPRGSNTNGPFHIIGPGYVHDVEYIRHYTGLNPIYLPYSLLDVITASYTGEKSSKVLFNAGIRVPAELEVSEFEFINPTSFRYELADLAAYQAALVLPYSITNTKSLEQYEMNIPLFVPTPEFAVSLGLFNDRTATYGPYCSKDFTDALHPPAHPLAPFEFSPNARGIYGGDDARKAEVFWVGFSEVYLWPCVNYFSSWKDLLQQLRDTSKEEFMETSRCMKQANKWRKYELTSNLCWALGRVDPAPRQDPGPRYDEAMQRLYGKPSF